MNRLRAGATAEDVAAAIRAELSTILDTTPEGRNAFESFGTRRAYAIFAKTRAFDKLAIHPRRVLEAEKEAVR